MLCHYFSETNLLYKLLHKEFKTNIYFELSLKVLTICYFLLPCLSPEKSVSSDLISH